MVGSVTATPVSGCRVMWVRSLGLTVEDRSRKVKRQRWSEFLFLMIFSQSLGEERVTRQSLNAEDEAYGWKQRLLGSCSRACLYSGGKTNPLDTLTGNSLRSHSYSHSQTSEKSIHGHFPGCGTTRRLSRPTRTSATVDPGFVPPLSN